VTAICATRGEVGEIAPGTNATPQTLGAVREPKRRVSERAASVVLLWPAGTVVGTDRRGYRPDGG